MQLLYTTHVHPTNVCRPLSNVKQMKFTHGNTSVTKVMYYMLNTIHLGYHIYRLLLLSQYIHLEISHIVINVDR